MMKTIIGVSGDVGSFSEQAALRYANKRNLDSTLAYLIDMEGVLAAVEKGDVDLGIFPVVNMQGGLVESAFQAMGRHLFTPIDDLWFDVHQYLLALPGLTANNVTKIVSHAQGLAQCKRYLENTFSGIAQLAWCDTAKAAKDLAEGKLDAHAVVIAPEHCAKLYGLNVLAKDIQDSNPNLTAFLLVKKQDSL
jgi:prephenate dehydratase